MWTIAAANKRLQGPLGSYNGLTDIHLAHYFSSPAKLSHLKEANLITEDGIIIPEQTYKVETLKYEKQKHLYDFLARNIIQNAALEESCLNKKLYNYLEDISKMQVVENIKGNKKKLCRNLSLNLNKMKATVAPVHSTQMQESMLKKYKNFKVPRSAFSSVQYSQRNNSFSAFNASKLKRCYSAKDSSPYTFPMLSCNHDKNQFSLLLPNGINLMKKRKHKRVHSNLDPEINVKCTNKVSSTFKNISTDRSRVTLFYHGHGVANFTNHFRKEIVIKQQHCGGTSVAVFKGDIAPNETITFTSLTHEGFPFSITIFLDGIRDLKLSSCCVFRYTLQKRLGGLNGNFSIEKIIGGKKCLKCQYLESISLNNSLKKDTAASEELKETDEVDNFVEKEKSVTEELENTKEVVMYDDLDVLSASIKSENSAKYEDIEESLSVRSDLPNSESETQISEEYQVKKTDIDGKSNFGSESSTISSEEPAYDIKQENFKTSNYQSESSSEDENGKEHVVLASVHNLPT